MSEERPRSSENDIAIAQFGAYPAVSKAMFCVKSNGLFRTGSMVDGGNHASRSAIVGVDASPDVVHATAAKACSALARLLKDWP